MYSFDNLFSHYVTRQILSNIHLLLPESHSKIQSDLISHTSVVCCHPHSAESRSSAAKSFNLSPTNHNHQAHLLLSRRLWKSSSLFQPHPEDRERTQQCLSPPPPQKMEPYSPLRKSLCVCLCPTHVTVLRIRDFRIRQISHRCHPNIQSCAPLKKNKKKTAQHHRLNKKPPFPPADTFPYFRNSKLWAAF